MKTLLILAGGFGSRLKTVVSEVPKPLAPVCGHPFLKYIIKNCVSQGVNDIVFLLHYEARKIQDMLDIMKQKGDLNGVKVRTVIEGEPLGTGGAILNAIETLELNDSFMVMNADTWLGTGIALINNAGNPSLAAIKVKDCKRYGSVKVHSGLVKEFTEKKFSEKEGLINAGLYHLSDKDFNGFIPGTIFSLEEEVLPKLVNTQSLMAINIKTNFVDIGVPDDYFRFCEWIEKGEQNEL